MVLVDSYKSQAHTSRLVPTPSRSVPVVPVVHTTPRIVQREPTASHHASVPTSPLVAAVVEAISQAHQAPPMDFLAAPVAAVDLALEATEEQARRHSETLAVADSVEHRPQVAAAGRTLLAITVALAREARAATAPRQPLPDLLLQEPVAAVLAQTSAAMRLPVALAAGATVAHRAGRLEVLEARTPAVAAAEQETARHLLVALVVLAS